MAAVRKSVRVGITCVHFIFHINFKRMEPWVKHGREVLATAYGHM